MPAGSTLIARVDVQNAGKRAGDEVAQLYRHAVAPGVKRPIKELRGFESVSLKRGEKRDVNKYDFIVEPGKLIGGYSDR